MSKSIEEFEKKVKAALEKANQPQGNPQDVVNKLLEMAKRKGVPPRSPVPPGV